MRVLLLVVLELYVVILLIMPMEAIAHGKEKRVPVDAQMKKLHAMQNFEIKKESVIRSSDMDVSTSYAFGKSLDAPFGEVELKVRAELAKEGFGILSEINVQDKFKEKLGKDFREYIILGACNPPLAWEAFGKEINIGTLLPCNVVVYCDDRNRTVVMVMDPVAALGVIGNSGLTEIAAQVRAKMERVLTAI